MRVVDKNEGQATPCRWTFGTDGREGRFGAAYPDGTVNLWGWVDENGTQNLACREIKTRSYRRAVFLLRQHLKGYNV